MRRGLGTRRATAALLAAGLVAALGVSPAAAVRPGQGQFVLRCPYSHTLTDDPIVMPGQPGASHSHDFFGNTTVNASSTLASMLAGETTCRVPSDTAGYWAPTAYLNGAPIRPTVMRIYYLGGPGVETIPPGLQMIGGNRDATSGAENPHVRWFCGETRDVKTPRATVPYDCSFYSQYGFVDGVIAIVDMPSCWDGVGLTPDSVTYPMGGSCPAAFPRVLPRLSQRIHFGIMDPTNPDGSIALTFSNGEYWTYHSDFWNTWQQERLDQLVEECLQARVHCGSVDASRDVDWVSQFGTQRYDLAWASDAEGSAVYVAGFTNYELPGQDYRRRYDAFVRKYDRTGEVLWTRQFGSSGIDQVLAVEADGDGVTVVGSTDGRIPGQDTAGGVDAFATRFGAAGRQLWIRQFGTRADDRATAIAAAGGRTFVAGTTGGAFGERWGGATDAFVAEIDRAGELRWIRQFGGEGADGAAGVAVRAGRVVVVGSTTGAIGDVYLGGASDGLAAAFRLSGEPAWRRVVGTEGSDSLSAVTIRARGLFVAGSTDGVLGEETPFGGLDAFVGKLDANGSGLWFSQFGSAADDQAFALDALGKGVYVAGSAAGELSDGETFGGSDGFVLKYLPNGTQLWTQQLGTDDNDWVYGLAVAPAGLYLTGTTHGAFEGFVNVGDRDVFLARIAFS